MSKTFNLKTGDDARQIKIRLTSTVVPSSAQLVISDKNGEVVMTKTLIKDVDTGLWSYQFDDDDFDELSAETGKTVSYKAEVYGDFGGGQNGTFPTVGTASIRVQGRLGQ